MLATDRPRARAHYTAALDLSAQTGDLDQQAHAHHGLARALQTNGDHAQAHHLHQALTLYTRLGAPEADQTRAQPTTTNDHDRQPQA
jgi:hypothetical protein